MCQPRDASTQKLQSGLLVYEARLQANYQTTGPQLQTRLLARTWQVSAPQLLGYEERVGRSLTPQLLGYEERVGRSRRSSRAQLGSLDAFSSSNMWVERHNRRPMTSADLLATMSTAYECFSAPALHTTVTHACIHAPAPPPPTLCCPGETLGPTLTKLSPKLELPSRVETKKPVATSHKIQFLTTGQQVL